MKKKCVLCHKNFVPEKSFYNVCEECLEIMKEKRAAVKKGRTASYEV